MVVAMSHIGYLLDRRLAEDVEGIDVVCGGNTHLALRTPAVVGGVPIVHAGAYGEYLGSMLLKIDEKGALSSWEWKLIPIDASVPPDSETAAFLRPWQKSYPGLGGIEPDGKKEERDDDGGEGSGTSAAVSHGGGCDAGFGGWLMLLAVPFLFRRSR